MATTAAGLKTYLESDGKAVNVTLSYTALTGSLVYVEGWLGILAASGNSGETRALTVDDREYQLVVPAGLAAVKGSIIYITIATVTGHYPDDEAYTLAAGAGKIALMKVTQAKDSNNVVTGILLAKNALAS